MTHPQYRYSNGTRHFNLLDLSSLSNTEDTGTDEALTGSLRATESETTIINPPAMVNDVA
jgi:hypothetical protein